MNETNTRIKKIKDVIKALGWTQRQLEDATGLGYSTIWRVVNDQTKPRKTTLFLLERGLGIDR